MRWFGAGPEGLQEEGDSTTIIASMNRDAEGRGHSLAGVAAAGGRSKTKLGDDMTGGDGGGGAGGAAGAAAGGGKGKSNKPPSGKNNGE
ncbi:MAG: hypothetical protein ABJ360_02150 [Roseobacter sp.]